MFRHVEVLIIGDQVRLFLKVDTPKVPSDTKLCGPPCCCLPGCNYVVYPLFMLKMRDVIAPMYDLAMDAIEDNLVRVLLWWQGARM